jgi:hypothetical protein
LFAPITWAVVALCMAGLPFWRSRHSAEELASLDSGTTADGSGGRT